MPEVEFKIDTESGTCETEIKGYKGPACERTARQLKEILGAPKVDRKTAEYQLKPTTRRKVGCNE